MTQFPNPTTDTTDTSTDRFSGPTKEKFVVAALLGATGPTGKAAVKRLGRAHRNKQGSREGFTARLGRLPAGSSLLVYRENKEPFLDTDADMLGVYAVTGRMPHYARSQYDWRHFGKAVLRPDRLAYEVTFDVMPPLDDEGDLVFSLLRRRVGDSDHPETAQTEDEFFSALELDLEGRA